MDLWAPSPSPIALFLLGLDERGTDGVIEVGERTVVLRRGRVVDVRRVESDPSLHEFLRASGRVDEAGLEALKSGSADPDRLPPDSKLLSTEALGETMRALWLDRLVRGIAKAEAEGRAVPSIGPSAMRETAAIETPLVPLILDALERRAAEGDAEQVGARATHRLEWLQGPHLSRARRWASMEGKSDLRIGALLTSTPAAASRIAALVRAGLARIVPPGTSAPAPARRLISITPPAISDGSTRIPTAPLPPSRPDAPQLSAIEPSPKDRVTPEPLRHEAPRRGATLPPPALPRTPTQRPALTRPSSLPPPRGPEVVLSPGAARIFEHVGELGTTPAELPTIVSQLEDPLDAIEREIAILEETTATPADRASAWRRAADVWLHRYGSVEEHERALREAAAAIPQDAIALLQAADACMASARTELALAYGRAAVAAALEGEERDRVLQSYAGLCLRTGRASMALAALGSISEQASLDAHRVAASIHRARGRLPEAATELCLASSLAAPGDPVRAAFDRTSAWCLALLSEEPFEELVAALDREGRVAGIIGLETDAAMRTTSVESRLKLLLRAAERAREAGNALSAADLLERAFDQEPSEEAVYTALDAALGQADAPLERAIVLEEIANAASGGARAHFLNRAADARLDVPGDGLWELELRLRCLELTPGDERAMLAVRRQAEAALDPRIVADALERMARAKTWPSVEAQRAALEELATIADELTNEPLRAAWARSMAASIAGDQHRAKGRLAPSTRPTMQRAAELERISRQSEPEEARRARLELAAILAQDPERRDRAAALLEELLEEGWDSAAGELLERIFAIRGDVPSRIAALERRATRESHRANRIRALLWIASLSSSRGAHHDAAQACLKILAEVPSHSEALIRLRRAASRLSHRELLMDALEREGRLELPPALRGRVFSSMAMIADAEDDIQKAVSAAARALEHDAQAGAAAWILARRVSGETHVSSLSTERARILIGDAPNLLAASIRDAETESLRLQIAEQWSELAPSDAQPWLVILNVARERGEADLVDRALCELLVEPRGDIAHMDEIERAIAWLAERGELARATGLSVATMDRYGEAAASLRALAWSWTEQNNMPALATRVLERLVASSVDVEAVTRLGKVAEHHRNERDFAAEARALLRVLARAPRDGGAIERLADIYARTGEYERWLAVLALRVSDTAGDAERVEGWLALANAEWSASQDRERAIAFAQSAAFEIASVHSEEELERMFRVSSFLVGIGAALDAVELLHRAMERGADMMAGRIAERAAAILVREVGDLPRALDVTISGIRVAPRYKPLLLAGEHLALELGDVDSAERVYRELIERAIGANGERALLYRRARFLERAGHDAAALEAYLEAAAHSASSGVVLTAIERLARATSDLDALARGLLLLAENTPHPAIKLGMRRRAAALLEQEIGRPERAFAVLFPAWKQMGLSELEDDLGRLARAMRRSSPESGDKAFAALVAELERRAEEAWIAEEKARLLMKSARLHALFMDDLVRAEEQATTALSYLRGDSDIENHKIAAALTELASWLVKDSTRATETLALVAESLALCPDSEPARELAARLGFTSKASEPATAATATATAAEQPATSVIPNAEVDITSTDDDELVSRIAQLRSTLMLEPWRIDALLSLHELATRASSVREATLTSALISTTDPVGGAARHIVHVNAHALAPERELLFRDPMGATGRKLLELLWESALPIFKITLAQLGVVGTDRVGAHSASVLGRSVAAVLEALPDDTAVFAAQLDHTCIVPVRTHPPAIVIGSSAPFDNEGALRFLIGRALELARPAHILVATFGEDEGRTFFSAVRAAFGPAEEASISRDAAAIAAALWRTIPARDQREIRELLLESEDIFDWDKMRGSAFASAARAGLAASGDLASAVHALLSEHGKLEAARSLDTLGDAIAELPELSALIRFAFSDVFLATLR